MTRSDDKFTLTELILRDPQNGDNLIQEINDFRSFLIEASKDEATKLVDWHIIRNALTDEDVLTLSSAYKLFGLEAFREEIRANGINGLNIKLLLRENVQEKIRERNGKPLSRKAASLLKHIYMAFSRLRMYEPDFDFFSINGEELFLPYYTLKSFVGEVLASKQKGIKGFVRGKGKTKAIPKIIHTLGVGANSSSRTCYIPELDLEVKGAGDVFGPPFGDFGARDVGETPDPIGGIIEGKALYEFNTNLYLYLAGVDVPEPIGVVRLPGKFKGPEGDRLAVLIRRTKTPFRGHIDNTKKQKAEEELAKMNYLGLLHCWFNSDNYNAEGQILDTEGISLAKEYRKNSKSRHGNPNIENWEMIYFRERKKKNAKMLWKEFFDERKTSHRGDLRFIIEEAAREYNEIDEEVNNLRIMPSYLIRCFASDLADKISPYSARNYLRDPRQDLGRLAYHISRISGGKTKQMAKDLYNRYQSSVNQTLEAAKTFENVDFLQEAVK
jgi:hypothetical protein